jgi:glycogen debranching enzyme
MSDDLVKILDGNTFVVSDPRGDIEASMTDPTGLFSFDTRFLSRWVLTIDGERLNALSTDDLQYFETRFFLVPGTGTVYIDAKLSVIRQRAVGDGFHEELTILNHDDKAVDLTVHVEAGSDFADLFEVKDALQKKGAYYSRVEDGRLVLGYERETFARETWISATTPCKVEETGLTFKVHVEAHGEWTTDLHVVTAQAAWGELREETKYERHRKTARPNQERSLQKWLDDAPSLDSDWDWLKLVYQRSLVDLAALRFSPRTSGGRSLPAAGLPWFMTMFGRDSIFTSLQALPFAPELAATTLRELGERQGSRLDDFRDEDPGRILHEMRYGEMTAFEERPHSPYYGSVDATPLFVVLLDEHERWTGDARLVRELEFEARAALNWIDEYADLQHNGYIWYKRRNETTGLENQCWKDSWDSISFRDGTLPGFPRATCELQGYAYDARMRGARLARRFWKDPAFADKLEAQAADLKRRFNRDYWVEDEGYYAIALDTEGRKVDALSSNIGHLLWSGIVDKSKARSVARHLMGSRLYSGWGVRTLAEGQGRYNPIGYHVGTVWPFDNSIIAWGLRRYGFKQEAARIAAGILDAANFFDGRLPEAFGGYARDVTKYPVQYPTSCSPQAWSTGAPLLLLRTMLGLEPIGEHLVVGPALPRARQRGWGELPPPAAPAGRDRGRQEGDEGQEEVRPAGPPPRRPSGRRSLRGRQAVPVEPPAREPASAPCGRSPLRRRTASRSTHSICALTLRSSSAAHFSTSAQISGSMRRRNCLRAAIAQPPALVRLASPAGLTCTACRC